MTRLASFRPLIQSVNNTRTMSSSSSSRSIEPEKIKTLLNYSACDVSDALLKLQKVSPGTTARAGHLADFVPFSPTSNKRKIIAPASTFKFIPKDQSLPFGMDLDPKIRIEDHGFPPGTYWVDHAEPGTVVVVEQPTGQYCAAVGGIMAARMKVLGVQGVVVDGRIRDLGEIRELELPVWAHSTSTVGTGAESKPATRNLPICISGIEVRPGDIIFCDPVEGVVAIPRELLDQVIELMPKLVDMDDKVKEAVAGGESVFEAFKRFRTKI